MDTEERRQLRDLLRQAAQQDAKLEDILRRVEHIETQQADVLGQLNRWKGAVPVLLAVGGFVAWLINLLIKLAGKSHGT